jgi:peptidoglycan/xylan/chitin deacetylase (PgdA/CDA1 family)
VVGLGQITLRLGRQPDWFARCYAAGWQEHYRQLHGGDREVSWLDCYGGNFSVDRELFASAGGFGSNLRRADDTELAFRLAQRGATFVYLPQAMGCHDEQKRIEALAAAAENSGAEWVAICQRHPVAMPQVLGWLMDTSPRENVLRRLVSILRLSPRLLNAIGALLAGRRLEHRWYRFVQNYFYWRGARRALALNAGGRHWTQGTPILMYHAFAAPGEPASRFVIPIRRFAQQMTWLKRLGYQAISLEAYLHYRRQHGRPPPRAVVITIDDGYADVYTLAYPILRRYGFSATAFVVSSRVGAASDWPGPPELHGRRLMSWQQLGALHRGGLRLGAHTLSHPRLAGLPAERVAAELQGARTEIERRLQVSPLTLAFPYGEFDPAAQLLAEQAGYEASCGVAPGLNSALTPLHALRRTEVDGRRSLAHFLVSLWTGMSWPASEGGRAGRSPERQPDRRPEIAAQ